MDWVLQYWIQVCFGLIVSAFIYACRKMQAKFDEQDAVKLGVQALLRDRILQGYNHYEMDYGYCPISARENIQNLYKQYTALGGNGVIVELVSKLMALPTEPPAEVMKCE